MKKWNYRSTYEFLADVDGLNLDPNRSASASTDTDKHRVDFSGTDSYEHMLKNAAEGINLVKVDEIRQQIMETLFREEAGMVYDVVGDYVDVGMFLSGEPECMVDFRNVEKAAQYVHIVMNIGEGSGIDSELISKRGAIMAAVIDKLEHDGTHRVKLSMARSHVGNDSPDSIIIQIKDYDELLNTAVMTGALHTGFYRRGYFGWIERYYPNAARKGYGTPAELNKKHFEFDNENVMFVGSITHTDNKFIDKLYEAHSPKAYADCANELIKMINENE